VNAQELEVDDGIGEYEDAIDTPVIPPGTQLCATQSKAEKRNRLSYAVIATLYTPLQRLTDRSGVAGVSGSSPLGGTSFFP